LSTNDDEKGGYQPRNLKAGQVRVAQLHLVLVQEVLGDGALHRLPVLELQREALHLAQTFSKLYFDVTDEGHK
jgi:hypothetical protein